MEDQIIYDQVIERVGSENLQIVLSGISSSAINLSLDNVFCNFFVEDSPFILDKYLNASPVVIESRQISSDVITSEVVFNAYIPYTLKITIPNKIKGAKVKLTTSKEPEEYKWIRLYNALLDPDKLFPLFQKIKNLSEVHLSINTAFTVLIPTITATRIESALYVALTDMITKLTALNESLTLQELTTLNTCLQDNGFSIQV